MNYDHLRKNLALTEASNVNAKVAHYADMLRGSADSIRRAATKGNRQDAMAALDDAKSELKSVISWVGKM